MCLALCGSGRKRSGGVGSVLLLSFLYRQWFSMCVFFGQGAIVIGSIAGRRLCAPCRAVRVCARTRVSVCVGGCGASVRQ